MLLAAASGFLLADACCVHVQPSDLAHVYHLNEVCNLDIERSKYFIGAACWGRLCSSRARKWWYAVLPIS